MLKNSLYLYILYTLFFRKCMYTAKHLALCPVMNKPFFISLYRGSCIIAVEDVRKPLYMSKTS